MKRTLFSLTLLCLLCLPGFGCAGGVSSGKITPADPRCEWTQNPLGMDIAQPRLSWSIQSEKRDQFQTAFQILAASSAELLAGDRGDLWDSGMLTCDETIQILYNGKPLKSSQQVLWKIRVWDKDNKPSAWSRPASWTMGLLSEDDWHAHWVGADANSQTLLLRREFTVKPKHLFTPVPLPEVIKVITFLPSREESLSRYVFTAGVGANAQIGEPINNKS